MNDQSSSPAANVNPIDGQQSNALNKEIWMIENLAYTEDLPPRAFFSYALTGDSTNVSNGHLKRTPG
jgi:hypothetical protein